MALPGLSLPGLGTPQTTQTPLSATHQANVERSLRKEDLGPQTEWRFEAGFSQAYNVRLLNGHAELFGVELATNRSYNLSGCKGAIFTWQGCQLEISGDAESEYSAQETEYATEWLNVHGMLESARDASPNDGPKVLIVGPDHAGKSSLVRSVAAWAVKVGRTPTIMNLDPREGILAPPASLTAATVGSQLDVENSYGISSVSGPTLTSVTTPLIYHFPYVSPSDKADVFKAITTRMALSVTNKLEEDASARQAGLIVDTPGALNDPKSNYDLINHIVSEFSINLILTIGSERLFNDMSRRFSTGRSSEEAIPVLRITKPGGAVERDTVYMKQLRTQQIRQYFFGTAKESLSPHSHSVTFGELNVYRAKSEADTGAVTAKSTFGAQPDDEDDLPYANPLQRSSFTYEKTAPSAAMTGSLLAIKFCSGNSDEATVRDSAVMGFLYVAEVDEPRKKVRFLAPHPQRWGDRALVWGSWPEAVADLVT